MLTFENAYRFLKRRHKFLNDFESGIFPIKKQTQGKGHPSGLAHVASVAEVSKYLKISTPKQMFQRLYQ